MITSEEMRKLEDNCGKPKIDLMEAAGRGIANYVRSSFNLDGKKITLFCGQGNNGGDGFVAARYLKDIADVTVLFLGEEDKLPPEAKENFDKIKDDVKIIRKLIGLEDSNILIDAMLGIGIEGEIREPIKSAIKEFNNSTAYKIAVDIPSGLDPDTGEQKKQCVLPDIILTIHDKKPSISSVDNVIVIDVGLK